MFKFSLETVLKHRQIREERAASALVEVTERLQQLYENLKQLQILQKDELNSSLMALEKGVPISEMELSRFCEVKLMHEISALTHLVQDTEKEKLEKKEELLSRVKDRRLLERLREEHFLAYKQENEKLELRSLDEIAIIRAACLKK